MSKASEETSENASKLLELARKRFGKLNKAEEKLFRYFANGEVADYSAKKEEDNDPAKADKWGRERVLDADRIAWLCTDRGALELATHNGIQVRGARIDGEIDLSDVRIPFQLYFVESAFTGVINLRDTEIRNLNLSDSHTGPIYGDGLKVEGSVFLRHGFKAEGEVNLVAATISGGIECDGSQFINKGATALNANRANIGSSVYLRGGFKAEGEVDLTGATIDGNLECDGSQFINKGAIALSVNRAKVGSSFYLRNGFKSDGLVDLTSATINGNLECDDSQFINEGATALNTDAAKIKGSVFLRDGFNSEGVVNLVGAKIGGCLDCSKGKFINPNGYALIANSVNIEGSVYLLEGFKAEGEVNLVGAAIGGNLECDGSQFINKKGAIVLSVDGANIEGSIYLRQCFTAEGEVNLVAATISGGIECDGSQFINKGATALNANRANISSSVYLRGGFKAEGEVDLTGATIDGNLECDGSQFINKGATVLRANSANIGGSVYLRNGFEAKGEVNLVSATIGSDFDCSGGEFINKGRYAISTNSMKVQRNVYMRGGFKAEGWVDLVNARIDGCLQWRDVNSPEGVTLDLRITRIGTLYDNADSWPDEDKLFLHGLVYNDLADKAPRDADSRIEWLRRQSGFWPQPYEQLAAVLRKGGQDQDARKILIAKNKDKARLTKLTWSEWFWYRVFGLMIGYGYRPWRALGIGFVIVLIGWLFFWAGNEVEIMMPTKDSAYVSDTNSVKRDISPDYPPFCAPVYSLDVFVPLVDLHQSSYWLPNANRGDELPLGKYKIHISGKILRYYLWFEIIAGWILTSLLVVGLTGLVRT